ncbi:MAG: NADH-quinone oxidoreductase subunit C [Lachnospiraceae bacterium]|nr:NADH-quinone oxidoreductase subunit C [Lachnospiraceae bacterium]
MANTVNPKYEIEEITVDNLVSRSEELIKSGYRFSQANAAYVDEKFELSYSFSNYDNYDLLNLRLVIDTDTEVKSITEVVPAAVFYENEMHELFGVNIVDIALDYKDRLYRIKKECPFGPDKKEEE